MSDERMTPAACVFEAFGGVQETARILGISAGTVARWHRGWYAGEGERQAKSRTKGSVPIHHIQALLLEAERRGKPLTLEHLVFGRDPATQGVVVVRSGRKVEIKLHDTFSSMCNTLVGAA